MQSLFQILTLIGLTALCVVAYPNPGSSNRGRYNLHPLPPRPPGPREALPITICPTPPVNLGCECIEEVFDYHSVLCSGDISQSNIEEYFTLLRQANNVTSDVLVSLMILSIDATFIRTLDLSIFNNTDIDSLYITNNYGLTSFTGADAGALVDIYNVIIDNTNFLTHEGYRDLFRVAPGIKGLHLYGRNAEVGRYDIGDGSGDIEFLPGVSLLTKLDSLAFLIPEQPLVFGGGQFKRHRNIREIIFDRPNWITGESNKLEADALLLDDADEDYGGYVLNIKFWFSYSDDSFDSSKGPVFPAIRRWSTIDLESNRLTYLDEKHFKVFLDSHERNGIDMRYNILTCDQRMKWLKDGTELYEERVTDAMCSNDPGQTVFTTDLIT